MSQRVYNFSAGPAVLPEPVLAEVQRDLMALPGVGASILEISHRSKAFDDIIQPGGDQPPHAAGDSRRLRGAVSAGRRAAAVLDDADEPAAARGGSTFDYILTGSWGKYAAQEAAKFGEVRTAWDGKATNYDRLPRPAESEARPAGRLLPTTSRTKRSRACSFRREPETGDVPLVCDASSDFLSRPVDIKKYGLLYACAQKNAGPAGVTVVVIRKDLLERSRDIAARLSELQDPRRSSGSLWNTPPTFAIYVVMLVTKWLLTDIGGLDEDGRSGTASKAKLLYDVIDASGGFYAGHAQPDCRSLMNVTFRLPSDELTHKFVEDAKAARSDRAEGPPLASAASARRFTTPCRSQASKSCASSWTNFATKRTASALPPTTTPKPVFAAPDPHSEPSAHATCNCSRHARPGRPRHARGRAGHRIRSPHRPQGRRPARGARPVRRRHLPQRREDHGRVAWRATAG